MILEATNLHKWYVQKTYFNRIKSDEILILTNLFNDIYIYICTIIYQNVYIRSFFRSIQNIKYKITELSKIKSNAFYYINNQLYFFFLFFFNALFEMLKIETFNLRYISLYICKLDRRATRHFEQIRDNWITL